MRPMAAIIPATTIVQPTRHAAVTVLSFVIDFATASASIAVLITGKDATLESISDLMSGPARSATTMSAEHRERITVTLTHNGERRRCRAGRMGTVTAITTAISVKLGARPICGKPMGINM